MVLVTQTKMTIFRPFIIFERVHFVDAVIVLKHDTYWDTLNSMWTQIMRDITF
jgi:hypothetical protein